MEKVINIIDKVFTTITGFILVILMLFSIYAIYDEYNVYNSAKLKGEVLSLSPEEKKDDFSLSKLREVNQDIIGWIKIDNTTINYPVLKSKDNVEYLTLDYKKDYAITGSIFLDYRNNNFKDNFSIIYGHNMNFVSLMFGDIKKFKDKSFFDQNNGGTLYTLDGEKKLEIYLYSVISAYDEVYKLNNKSNQEIIDYLSTNAIYISDIDINNNEKLVLLSTCDTSGVDQRSIILAKVV